MDEGVENSNLGDGLQSIRSVIDDWFRSRECHTFGQLLEDAHVARTAALEAIARRLAPRINNWIFEAAPSGIVEKQALAKTLNNKVRSLGLAFVCPKTGEPGFFSVEHGDNAKEGRFRLVVLKPGSGRQKTTSSNQLPQHLRLRPLPFSDEGEFSWSKRMRQSGSTDRGP